MIVNDIANYLEAIAPLSLQEGYDNSGLLLGDPQSEVVGILLTLDVTNDVIQEALDKKCNLIIAHHPIIFSGIKRLTNVDPIQRVVVRAIREDLSIYAIHTNLDNSFEGLNNLLLRKLGVEHAHIIQPKSGILFKLVTFVPIEHADKVRGALFEAGAGHIGKYDACSYNIEGTGTFRASDQANPFVGAKHELHLEPEIRVEVIFPSYIKKQLLQALWKAHPYEEVAYDIYPLDNAFTQVGAGMVGDLVEPIPVNDFFNRIKQITGIPVIRTTANGTETVRRVALCTGSGSFLIHDAMKTGADIYLTADLKYHEFSIPENKMLLADIGHYESEQFAKEWLHEKLIEKFPTFAILISEKNTNPINYI